MLQFSIVLFPVLCIFNRTFSLIILVTKVWWASSNKLADSLKKIVANLGCFQKHYFLGFMGVSFMIFTVPIFFNHLAVNGQKFVEKNPVFKDFLKNFSKISTIFVLDIHESLSVHQIYYNGAAIVTRPRMRCDQRISCCWYSALRAGTRARIARHVYYGSTLRRHSMSFYKSHCSVFRTEIPWQMSKR